MTRSWRHFNVNNWIETREKNLLYVHIRSNLICSYMNFSRIKPYMVIYIETFHPLKVKTYKKICVPYFYLYYNILRTRRNRRGDTSRPFLVSTLYKNFFFLICYVPILSWHFLYTCVCNTFNFLSFYTVYRNRRTYGKSNDIFYINKSRF